MNILEVRAKRVFGNPIVEISIIDQDATLFITIADADGLHFTVSESSVLDYFEDESVNSLKVLEEYEDVGNSKYSKYYEYINLANIIYASF